jgi:MFS family permease
MGVIMGLSSLGIVIGPVLGGVFTEKASWRWCFYLNLPFGAITGVILSIIRIPDAKVISDETAGWQEHLRRIDLPGFLLFTPGTIMLLLALQWGGVTYAWSSATIIGLFCGSVGMTIVFLVWEGYKGTEAMIPLPMLKRSVVVSAAVYTIMTAGPLLLITYYLPLWFQVVKNASPIMGGVYYLPSVCTQMIGSIVTGALSIFPRLFLKNPC